MLSYLVIYNNGSGFVRYRCDVCTDVAYVILSLNLSMAFCSLVLFATEFKFVYTLPQGDFSTFYSSVFDFDMVLAFLLNDVKVPFVLCPRYRSRSLFHLPCYRRRRSNRLASYFYTSVSFARYLLHIA